MFGNISSTSHKTKLIILTALVVLGGLIFFYINTSNLSSIREISERISSLLSFNNPFGENFTGKLYLTSLTRDGRRLDIYTYNLKSKKRERLASLLNRNMTASVSSDGRSLIFSSKALGSGNFAQLYVKDKEGVARQVTNSKTFWKTYPRFSPDKSKFVYMVRDKLIASSLIPNNWKIYTSDRKGRENFITNGVYPYFSPDGRSILILRKSGLYTVNLSTKVSKRVWSIKDGVVFTPMSISLSKDKQKLAWVNPYKGVISIFSISSWNPFVMKLDKEIKISATHSAFSSNNEYLAVQQVLWNKKTHKPSNTKIFVFKLSSEESKGKEVLDLSGEKLQENIILTDWR